MAVQNILGSDKLSAGFRAKYNETIDEIIENIVVDTNGVVTFTKHSTATVTIDLKSTFYTKTEIAALFGIGQATELVRGTAKLATETLVDGELDDLTIVTPLKLAEYVLKQRTRLFTAASSSAMTALVARRGDFCKRTDLSDAIYLLSDDDPTILVSWIPFTSAAVALVFGSHFGGTGTSGDPIKLVSAYENEILGGNATGGFDSKYIGDFINHDGTLSITSTVDNKILISVPDVTTLRTDLNKLSWKYRADVATTANITLSGVQTVDGGSLTGVYRVAVGHQTIATENGLYNSNPSGAWTLVADWDATQSNNQGAAVFIRQGTVNANKILYFKYVTGTGYVWVADSPSLYTTTGSHTDGAMDQNSTTNELALKEVISNKTNDTTLAADSATLYPTEHAVKTYVDNAVTAISSLGTLVGDFDASAGLLPTTGSGTSGAIRKGDYWRISVAGTISGLTPVAALSVGDVLTAKVASATTASQFFALQANYSTTDDITEGSTNLYFTVARVLATVLTGLGTGTNTPITASDTLKTALQNLQAEITANTTSISNKWGISGTGTASNNILVADSAGTAKGSNALKYDPSSGVFEFNPLTQTIPTLFNTNKVQWAIDIVTYYNTSSTGNTVHNFAESNSNYSNMGRLNSAVAGNYNGTTIPYASSFRMFNTSGTLGMWVYGSNYIWFLTGLTGTETGARIDQNGLKIGTGNTLHVAALGRLEIQAGTASIPQVVMNSSVSYTGTQDGAIQHDTTLKTLTLYSNATLKAMLYGVNGNSILNPTLTALGLTATNGFTYIGIFAGTPTGTPTTIAGNLPIGIDSTNNLLYFYSAGWKPIAPSAITAAATQILVANGTNSAVGYAGLTYNNSTGRLIVGTGNGFAGNFDVIGSSSAFAAGITNNSISGRCEFGVYSGSSSYDGSLRMIQYGASATGLINGSQVSKANNAWLTTQGPSGYAQDVSLSISGSSLYLRAGLTTTTPAIAIDATGIRIGTNNDIHTANTVPFSVFGKLTVDANNNISLASAALATTATDGYTYSTTCAGTPTGVPTTKTGRVVRQYDSTNKLWYTYDGGWNLDSGSATPDATTSVKGKAKLFTATGTGIDGAMDQNSTTTALATKKDKITAITAVTKGSASNSAIVTVNAQGDVTAISETSIQITESQVTNLTTDLGNKWSISSAGAANSILVQDGAGTAQGYSDFTRHPSSFTISIGGDLNITYPGSGLKVKSGANTRLVQATLSGGTVDVTNSTVTGATIVIPCAINSTNSAALSWEILSSSSVPYGFRVKSTNASDSSTIWCFLIEAT